jgi:hypothetical protein
MNSTSTEDSSFKSENKENNDSEAKDEDDGFKEYKNKKMLKRANFKKATTEVCFVKNIFHKYGCLYLFNKNSRIFVSKMKQVNFPIRRDIFDKGKKEVITYDITTIPDIKFWYQRYYYYSKFDEGIMMDYECKIGLFRLVFGYP